MGGSQEPTRVLEMFSFLISVVITDVYICICPVSCLLKMYLPSYRNCTLIKKVNIRREERIKEGRKG